jgi:hypothetical protein
MSYEELKNNPNESENLSGEHEEVRQMCGNLKRVNAPKDFDFHLKARIANANPNDFQQNAFLPFLRYALPLCLVIFLAGFVVFSGILNSEQSNTIAEKTTPNQAPDSVPNAIPTSAIVSSNTLIAANSSNPVTAVANSEQKKTAPNNETASATNKNNNLSSVTKDSKPGEDFGGTRESTSRDTPIFTPRGIPPTSNVRNNQSVNIGNQSRSSVKEMLNIIGIEADFMNSGWSVKSVTDNSLASRSGIKMGDFIESADGRKLDSETISAQSFSPKIIYVLREGKKIAVELR